MALSRGELLARIVRRAAVLVASGTFRSRAGRWSVPRLALQDQEAARFLAAILTIARTSRDVGELLSSILPAAIREPGRIYARHVVSTPPLANIHWPRTLSRCRGRESITRLEFVGSVGRRETSAPENVLLALTLEDVSNRGESLDSVARYVHVSKDERRVVATARRRAQAGLAVGWLSECAGEAHKLKARGREAVVALEREVARRGSVTSNQAPPWARDLVRVRSGIAASFVGERLQLPELDDLTSILACLELFGLLRECFDLREMWGAGDEVRICERAGPRTLVPLAADSNSPLRAWALEVDGAPRLGVGAGAPWMTTPAAVRSAATESYFTRHGAQELKTWLIVHGCRDVERYHSRPPIGGKANLLSIEGDLDSGDRRQEVIAWVRSMAQAERRTT